MADPVRIGGFFSNFDTEAVIAQLTQARQIKIRRMDVEQARAEVRKSLLGDITSRLATLLTRANSLTGPASVIGKTASATGTAVSAAADASAALGSFTIAVSKLATGTRATGSALTAAINATAPMSQANFGTTPTNGTFTIGTAGGGTAAIKVGATAVNSAALLNASNFQTSVASGTFTIATATGGSQQFTVDTATQSLDDVVAAINASAIGVTASVVADANGRLNTLSITSTRGAITFGVSGDTSNFVAATNLANSTGTTTRTATAAMSVQMSLNEVVADINASGVGITATITNDANGRANILTMNAATAISLGNANDSSNFLAAANLLASPGTTTRASTMGMARLNPSQKLAVASFHAGAPAAGDHTFTINGVSIAYNAANDSLNDVIGRINASGAGVVARYDTATDTLRLDQTKSGSMAITLADDGSGGDFLAKTGLLAAGQTLGQNAEFSINGGATQYSASNSVTAIPGVTATLNATTEVGSPATITVSQNTAGAIAAVKAFITDFNAAFETIDKATKTDAKERNNAGELSGDASVRQLKTALREAISSAGLGITGTFKNLNEIGIGFGAPGSAVGTTNTLQLNEVKFTEALARDPAGVQNLLNGFSAQATLTPGGTGSIAGMTGSYSGTKTGRYTLIDDGFGHITAEFRADDGSPMTSVTATVTAGGTNTTLIPGMTLQIGPAFQGGEHTVVVAATQQSPMHRVRTFLEAQAGAGGVLRARQSSYDAIAQDIDRRKAVVQERIDREMEVLRGKFRAMEQAQARSQTVLQALQQQAARSRASN